MKMSDWKKLLSGDMSPLKKEQKEDATISENKIYKLRFANGRHVEPVTHDEAVRQVNYWLNRRNFDFIRIINENTRKFQIVFEQKSITNPGFLHLKRLNRELLDEK